MAHYFPKIYAPFSRKDSKSKYVDETKWSKPEFSLLQGIKWVWTAKADGTSIRLYWDGERVSFFGYTDKSQLNERTLKYLNDTFGTKSAESIFEDMYGDTEVNVYGEFCSKDTNQNYGHLDGIFYPFDVQNAKTGQWWDRKAVSDFAKRFELQEVPIMFIGTIREAVEYVKEVQRTWNQYYQKLKEGDFYGFCCDEIRGTEWEIKNPFGVKYPIEGIVGRLPIELLNAKGERIITKVKCCDYEV